MSARGSKGWVLGRVGGAPVILSPSWLVIAAVLAFVFHPIVQRATPGMASALQAVAALSFPIALLASVLVHELAHGAAARSRAIPVREYVLSLWGGHTQFTSAMPSPGASALVAAAGPLANAAIALGGLALLTVADLAGLALLLCWAITYSNALVAAFNLLPGNPLDGGRLLEAAVWKASGDRHAGTIAAGWVGRALAIGVVVGVIGLPLAQGRAPTTFSAVWGLVLGWLLWSGASASLRFAAHARRVSRLDLRSLARPLASWPAQVTLDLLPDSPATAVAATSGGSVVGLLDPAAFAAVPRAARATTVLASVCRAVPPEALVRAASGEDALAQAARGAPHSSFLVLMGPGGPEGVIAISDVEAVLRA